MKISPNQNSLLEKVDNAISLICKQAPDSSTIDIAISSEVHPTLVNSFINNTETDPKSSNSANSDFDLTQEIVLEMTGYAEKLSIWLHELFPESVPPAILEIVKDD
jgi:hypothetical protein